MMNNNLKITPGKWFFDGGTVDANTFVTSAGHPLKHNILTISEDNPDYQYNYKSIIAAINWFKSIDVKLLREQKLQLMTSIMQIGEDASEEEAEVLDGLLHMIDDIQDILVKDFGAPEHEVFGISKGDTGEDTKLLDFLAENYPNYDRSDDVARWNDLACIVHGDANSAEMMDRHGYDQEDLDNNKIHLDHAELQLELLWEATQNFNKKDSDTIGLSWSIGDIQDCLKQEGIILTDEEAREYLKYLDLNHDANVGINWDVISDTYTYFKSK